MHDENAKQIHETMLHLAMAFGGHDRYTPRHVGEALSQLRLAGSIRGTNRDLGIIAEEFIIAMTGTDPESFRPYQVEEAMLAE